MAKKSGENYIFDQISKSKGHKELEGTLHPQKFGCTPKNEGKRVHVPPDEKTCGHTGDHFYWQNRKLSFPVPESNSGISFSKFSVK
jgi:hypothetical protein